MALSVRSQEKFILPAIDAEKLRTADAGVPYLVFTNDAVSSSAISDGTNLYVGRFKNGGIVRLPLAGGAPETVVAGATVQELTLDPAGNRLFFIDTNGGSVDWIDKQATSGAATPIATGEVYPQSLSIGADDTAYWVDLGTFPTFQDGSVRKATVGGTSTTLVPAWANLRQTGFDGTNVYFTSGAGLYAVAAAGGTPMQLSAQATPDYTFQGGHSFGRDASSVYEDGGVVCDSSAAAAGTRGLWYDAASGIVYFATNTQVWWCSTATAGPATLLVTDTTTITGTLTGDATSLYWPASGDIHGIAKP